MKMSDARKLVHLTLPKNFRKLSDSNALGYLLKLYKVDNERSVGRNMRDERTIKLLSGNRSTRF